VKTTKAIAGWPPAGSDLPDSIEAIEAGKPDRARPRASRTLAAKLARLCDCRVVSDLIDPPEPRQLELFTCRPASWEME
jgi:hypothetical protein